MHGSRTDPGIQGMAARLAHALRARAGCDVALAELGPRAARAGTPAPSDAKGVMAMLDTMRARFALTVADLEPQVSERTLAAFDAADRILVVTDGTVPSLRRAQRVLRLCRRLNYPDEKMCLVATWLDLPGAMTPADIAAALRRELFWKIGGDAADLSGLADRLVEEEGWSTR